MTRLSIMETTRQTQSYLRNLFAQEGIAPRRALGQNFLIDLNLHELIVKSADNQAIVDTYQSIHPILLQSRFYRDRGNGRSRIAEVNKEHAAILRAYQAGDGEAAREAIRVHFEGGRRRIVRAGALPTDSADGRPMPRVRTGRVVRPTIRTG